jgi:succinate--hydroxymethylglutarate CoA-transferase
LLEVCAANLANIGQNYHLDPRMTGRRWGTAHESIVPYQAFRCKPDGGDATTTTSSSAEPTYFICGALNNKQFAAMGKAVEELVALAARDPTAASAGPPLDASFMRSPDYANNALRVKHREALLSALQAVFARFPLATLVRVMEEHDIPSAPINDVGAVFADKQIQHAGLVRTVRHDGVGDINVTGPPVHYSRTEPAITRPPPMLGQHTQELLQEVLGASVDQVREWERQGAIGCYYEIK